MPRRFDPTFLSIHLWHLGLSELSLWKLREGTTFVLHGTFCLWSLGRNRVDNFAASWEVLSETITELFYHELVTAKLWKGQHGILGHLYLLPNFSPCWKMSEILIYFFSLRFFFFLFTCKRKDSKFKCYSSQLGLNRIPLPSFLLLSSHLPPPSSFPASSLFSLLPSLPSFLYFHIAHISCAHTVF